MVSAVVLLKTGPGQINKVAEQLAELPGMDAVAASGVVGRSNNVPESLPPGSDVANLSLLGYSPLEYFTGRAPLEAAAQGYQDVIRILYSYDPACECIRGIQVLKMAETPGIGDKIAKDPGFLQNFEALDARVDAAGSRLAHAIVSVKSGSKTEPWQIDAISGATISCKAVARMLNDSAQQAAPVIMRHLDTLQRPDGETP